LHDIAGGLRVSFRRRQEGETSASEGFTGFLRNLLSGLPWSERAERKEVLSFAAPDQGVLKIHNSNGRTKVMGEDRPDIEVTTFKTARAESPEAATSLLDEIQLVFQETGEGLALDVEIPGKWNRRGSANLCVKLPKQMMVAVTAVNGRVDVQGICGSVTARSSNGSATVANIVGDVSVATSNAKVCCHCIEGSLIARSSNGKIEIDEHCGSIDASTSNGLIRATIEGIGKGGVTLATSNGRIVLDLPEQIDADVDLRVDNGVIRNERELCKKMRDTGGRVLGRLGGGGPLIKLRTSNGSISLH
jgi:hypothetical protein